LRTDEGKEERKKEIREYKRLWAEKNKLKKGYAVIQLHTK
jgi:hypothetical protein